MSSPVTGQNFEPAHQAVTCQNALTPLHGRLSAHVCVLQEMPVAAEPDSAFLTAESIADTGTKHVSKSSATALDAVR